MIKTKLQARIVAVVIFFVLLLIYLIITDSLGDREGNKNFGYIAIFVTVLIYRMFLKPPDRNLNEAKHEIDSSNESKLIAFLKLIRLKNLLIIALSQIVIKYFLIEAYIAEPSLTYFSFSFYLIALILIYLLFS